jgi:hypothetical protein
MDANIKLYNFYKRYPWSADDFTGWQKGMVNHGRGMFEGLVGASVLSGFGISTNGNMTVTAASGIAAGPTGNLMAVTSVSSVVSISAPTASFERALLVVRPNLVNGDYVTNPLDPNATVPLTTIQGGQLALIRGTLSTTPTYPAAAANDAVLLGLRLYSGQTSILESDLDFEVRDIPGKNSNFQQDAAKYDDRLRVSRYTSNSIRIRPSQLELPHARVFSYVNRSRPSIYPKTSPGGLYNPADTFLNLTTGAITGGDQASSAVVPTIPSAGNWVNAVVAITTDDLLTVAYGTVGTRAQCYAGIKNQSLSGAGCLSFPVNSKPIAFLMLGSQSGSAITEIDLFDARGTIAVAGNLALDLTYDGKILLVNTAAPRTITLPAPAAGLKVTVKDASGGAGTSAITVARFGSETIDGASASYLINFPRGAQTFISDGTNWYVL